LFSIFANTVSRTRLPRESRSTAPPDIVGSNQALATA
jgi:hypothetical protein